MYIISFNTYNITIFERVSDFNKIKNQILQNRLEPLYILHGEEPYFIDKLSQLIEEHALTEEEKAFLVYSAQHYMRVAANHKKSAGMAAG